MNVKLDNEKRGRRSAFLFVFQDVAGLTVQHPAAVLMLEGLITFGDVILMGVVALMA